MNGVAPDLTAGLLGLAILHLFSFFTDDLFMLGDLNGDLKKRYRNTISISDRRIIRSRFCSIMYEELIQLVRG